MSEPTYRGVPFPEQSTTDRTPDAPCCEHGTLRGYACFACMEAQGPHWAPPEQPPAAEPELARKRRS